MIPSPLHCGALSWKTRLRAPAPGDDTTSRACCVMVPTGGRGPRGPDLWQAKDLREGVFGSVAMTGLTGGFFGSVANTGVRDLRVEAGKADDTPAPLPLWFL